MSSFFLLPNVINLFS